MQQQESAEKSFQLLMMVEEEVRRSGGKALLSREEYLQILAYCHQEVYREEGAKTNNAALQAQSR